MANSTTHSALDVPIRGALYNVPLVWLDADGDPTLPTAPDTEVSKDNGTFANTTNAPTLAKEVGGATDSAFGYVTLTAAEMTADIVILQAKDATQKATPVCIRPKRLPVIESGTGQLDGSASTVRVKLGTGASEVDDYYNGAIYLSLANTGAGQARRIMDYVGSTKIATVAALETQTDQTTTYDLLATPEWLTALNTRVLLGVPAVAAGGAGGLPTVDANNYVAGLQALGHDTAKANVQTEVNDALTAFDFSGKTVGTASKLGIDQSTVTLGTVSNVATVATLTNKTGFSLAADQSAVTIGTASNVATVATLTNKTGFSLAADQSSVTIGTASKLGIDQSTVTIGTASNANMIAISGDVTAADNFETMLDGTGGKKLTLEQVVINSSTVGGAVDIDNSGGPGIAVQTDSAGVAAVAITGNAAGAPGIAAIGGTTGPGLQLSSGNGIGLQATGGGTTGAGISAEGAGAGAGIQAAGGATGHGMGLMGGATSGDGLNAAAATSGDGISATGAGTGDGIEATKGASGADIDADITGTMSGNIVGSVTTASNAPSAAAIANALGQRVPDGTSDAGSFDWSMGLVSGRLRDEETTTSATSASRTLYKPNGTDAWGTYVVNTSASLTSYITGTRDS